MSYDKLGVRYRRWRNSGAKGGGGGGGGGHIEFSWGMRRTLGRLILPWPRWPGKHPVSVPFLSFGRSMHTLPKKPSLGSAPRRELFRGLSAQARTLVQGLGNRTGCISKDTSRRPAAARGQPGPVGISAPRDRKPARQISLLIALHKPQDSPRAWRRSWAWPPALAARAAAAPAAGGAWQPGQPLHSLPSSSSCTRRAANANFAPSSSSQGALESSRAGLAAPAACRCHRAHTPAAAAAGMAQRPRQCSIPPAACLWETS